LHQASRQLASCAAAKKNVAGLGGLDRERGAFLAAGDSAELERYRMRTRQFVTFSVVDAEFRVRLRGMAAEVFEERLNTQ
jgi:hypothetical protein